MDKFCRDCVHVIGSGPYAKCKKDPRGNYHLVTGDPRDQDFFHCSVTRQYGCGKRGRWFQLKELPKPKPTIDLGSGPIIDHNPEEFKKKSIVQRLLTCLK